MNKPVENPSFPPPERGQHDPIEHVKDAITGQEVFRITHPSQVEKYRAQGKLGNGDDAKAMMEAGLEYHRVAKLANAIGLPTTVNMHRISGVKSDGLAQQEAREKLDEADRVLGLTHMSCLRAVCVDDCTATAWARERYRQNGWGEPGAHYGMGILRDALLMLVAHWG